MTHVQTRRDGAAYVTMPANAKTRFWVGHWEQAMARHYLLPLSKALDLSAIIFDEVRGGLAQTYLVVSCKQIWENRVTG
jgi:hypothetical protein